MSTLVLSRKLGDTIIIGDDIEITVTRVDWYSVRLSIDAPREVLILRGELYEAMEQTALDESQHCEGDDGSRIP